MAVHLNSREHSVAEIKTLNNHHISTSRKVGNKLKDKFDNSTINKKIFKHMAAKDVTDCQNAELIEACKIPIPVLVEDCEEQKFIKNPNVKQFKKLAKNFEHCYEMGNHVKFLRIDEYMIQLNPDEVKDYVLPVVDSHVTGDSNKLEVWHDKNNKEYQKEYDAALKRKVKREKLIEEKGNGFGGHMTKVIGNTKEAAYFTKNNLTLRGNMFNLNNKIWGKSIYEMLPRYGSRKGRHIGVRVSQFTINTIIMAAGYGCAPVSFGVSVIVSNQLQTAVTLSGEVIALKLGGAKKRKITSHAALRGVQLEVLRIPIVGTIVNYAENAVFGTAAMGIVSTTIADWLFDSMSTRYTQTINLDDLGDCHVMYEMTQRIDYLSRFLIPYGQYLLLNENDPDVQAKLRKILKEQGKILKDLEHKNLKALNYYRIALLADKIPKSERDKISEACKQAEQNLRIKTHRTVRQSLAVLMKTNKLQQSQAENMANL